MNVVQTLSCPRSLKKNCKTEQELNALQATIKCENPTPHLYKFHGRIEFGKRTSTLLRQSALLRQQSLYAETMIDAVTTTCTEVDNHAQDELNAVNKQELDSSKASNENLYFSEEELSDIDQEKSEQLPRSLRSPVYLRKKFVAKRTESFPKSAIRTHKKTLSNVERMSFNLEKKGSPVPKLKNLSYERKASFFLKRVSSLLHSNRASLTTTDGNVIDPLSSENLMLRGSKLKSTDFVYGEFYFHNHL